MRILFIDDHHLVREALTWFLSQSVEKIEVVGVGTVDAALNLSQAEYFDLILLDYKMPGISGHRAIQTIRQRYDDTPIIILSGAITLEEANQALDLGVAGVISKDVEGHQLWDVIRSHMSGVSSISPTIAGAILPHNELIGTLSKRELQVAQLLVAGYPNKTIATQLGIADITVRLNLRQVYRKLGASSRTDAVRIMLQQR